MLRIKKQGFTLIELMVVIVIIGVLASLAIPRFTEASLKAKVAEAPGVLKGYESAFLAAVAEKGFSAITSEDLIYKAPDGSNWFTYTPVGSAVSGVCEASATEKLKASLKDKKLTVTYGSDDDSFTHTGASELTKLVPNFIKTP